MTSETSEGNPMAQNASGTPRIVDVNEMPERASGRSSAALEPLRVALRDGKPHAIEEVRTDEERRRWRRKLRRAAQREGLAVETRFVGQESRLYFRGRPRDGG